MQFGVVLIEDSDPPEVAHYHLTFDSGKKLLLSKEEGEEMEDRLKLAKAEGKMVPQKHHGDALEALEKLTQWFYSIPLDMIEEIEKGREECPMEDAVVCIAAAREKSTETVRADLIKEGLKI
jgi:hypothetical protein